jgi:molybdate transport system regulatory protein
LTGGQEVVAAITKDAAESLSLGPGDEVTAVIKATEVMVVGNRIVSTGIDG